MKIFKKSLSIFLCLAMIMSLFVGIGTLTASAVTAESYAGQGTETDPYVIASLANLKYLSEQSNDFSGKYIRLDADIDVSGSGIKNIFNTFNGTFDGNGHTISNISIEKSSANVGFIIQTSGCTIKNLTLSGEVTGTSNNVGGFIGVANSGAKVKLINCVNKINVKGTYAVGGFIGRAQCASVEITDSVNDGNVSATSTSDNLVTGGFIGILGDGSTTTSALCPNVTITGCINNGNVTSQRDGGDANIGGFIGQTSNSTSKTVNIKFSQNNGAISASTGVGGASVAGIIGKVHKETVNISYCINAGAITGRTNVAGIIGYNQVQDNSKITVRNCFTYGKLSTSATSGNVKIGAIFGQHHNEQTNRQVCFNSFYNSDDIVWNGLPEDIGTWGHTNHGTEKTISSADWTNGTVLNALNSDGEYFVQGTKYPVFSDNMPPKPVVESNFSSAYYHQWENCHNSYWTYDKGTLKGTLGGDQAYMWGFIINDYTVDSNKTPLVEGKEYVLTFKAKGEYDATIDYAVYGAGENTSAVDALSSRTNPNSSTMNLTNYWQEYSITFVAEKYSGGTRPYFYIISRPWRYTLWFDDMKVYDAEEYNEYYDTSKVGYYDFENSSYVVGGNNCYDDRYSVQTENDNSYLSRNYSGTNTSAYCFGFMLPETTLVPGRNYSISFKVRGNKDSQEGGNIPFNFTVLSGNTFYSNNITDGLSNSVFDADNHMYSLKTNEWTNVFGYFTAKDYSAGTNAYLYLLDMPWHYTFDFDDIEIREVKGISYNEYGNKYSKPYILGVSENVLPVEPERAGYIFDGWYVGETLVTEETVVTGFMSATAKWEEAVTTKDDIAEITTAGIYDLGIKVTNANAYPVKFSLVTDGKVTISIFTAAKDDATVSQSVVWEREFERGGNIGTLIEPNIISSCNELYISVDTADNVNVSISDFVIGGADVPTSRLVQGDANADDKFDIRDLISLKKMSVGTKTNSWVGDIDGDSFIADARDLIQMRKWLLLDTNLVVKTVGDRTLVWNEEFDSENLNSANFGYATAYGTNIVTSYTEDTLNYSDGKANLKVNNYDGENYKVSPDLTSSGKMSFNKGYLEVRAKINAVSGQWASIWLVGDDVDATYQGEIDVFETYNAGHIMPNIHSWKDGERAAQYGEENATKYVYADNDFNKTEYHIFGFEWDDTELKFYVDGVCYETINISELEKLNFGSALSPVYPFNGLLDQFYSVRLTNIFYDGSLSSGNAMPEFSIDYVRLYQKDGEQLKINGELVEK